MPKEDARPPITEVIDLHKHMHWWDVGFRIDELQNVSNSLTLVVPPRWPQKMRQHLNAYGASMTDDEPIMGPNFH